MVAAFAMGSAARAAGTVGPELPTAWQVDGWHPPRVLPASTTEQHALSLEGQEPEQVEELPPIPPSHMPELSLPTTWED